MEVSFFFGPFKSDPFVIIGEHNMQMDIQTSIV